jgi:YVTN family beta-propeller protein
MSGCAQKAPPPLIALEKSYSTVSIPVKGPSYVAVTPDNKKIYASNSESQTLSIIDIHYKKVEHTLKLDFNPSFIVFSRDGQFAFVGSLYSGVSSNQGDEVKDDRMQEEQWALLPPVSLTKSSIVKIDLRSRTIVSRIMMEKFFYSLGGVLSKDGKKLYVTDANDMFLTIIDTSKFQIIKRIYLGEGGGYGLAISPDDFRLYVTHGSRGSMTVIDLKSDSIIKVIKNVGKIPVAVAISQNGKTAYVVDNGEVGVAIIDIVTWKVVSKILTGSGVIRAKGKLDSFNPSSRMYFTPDYRELVVWNPYLTYIALIDLDVENVKLVKLKSLISIEKKASGMALDPSGRLLILSHSEDNTISLKRISRSNDYLRLK